MSKSIFKYFESKFGLKFNKLNFRFPIETLDELLKDYFKDFEESAFLLQANNTVPNLSLRKTSKSYILRLPTNSNLNEHIYVGISDLLRFLILFDEPRAEDQNISEQQSRFFLTFDQEVINSVFDYFYKNFCNSLSIRDKRLLIKLKNVKANQLEPYYVSKFQEALLISALNDNNKIKHAKLIEAISFTDEAIVITDLAGNVKEANRNFEKLCARSYKKTSIRGIIPEDVLETALLEISRDRKWQKEISLVNSSGKEELLNINASLFKDELDRPNGYVFTFKNITELKKLDDLNKQLITKLRERNLELSEVNKRLLEADRIKSDLLSVVSHELKTPIASILGFGELILNREYDTQSVRGFIEQINNSAKRLDSLITDYLDVACDQFGIRGNNLPTMPINLVDLIRLSYKEEKSKFPVTPAQLELNCLGYEPIVIAEAQNLKKVFCNLLNNSLKYSPEGGKISVKVLNDRENITVSIADEGVGLTLDQAKKVFDPFYRSDNSITREFNGIGLGLAVCKKIVEIYKGSIWCEPGIDKGSVFYVTLPVNSGKPKEVPSKEYTLNKQALETINDFTR